MQSIEYELCSSSLCGIADIVGTLACGCQQRQKQEH